MNLLSNIFDTDRIRIMEVNRKYMSLLILILLVIFVLLLIKKNCYYVNTITKVGDNNVLVVEKEKLSHIKNNKQIIIDGIEIDYSINRIEVLDNVCFVYINNIPNNIHDNTYKIYLGKESVFEYIVRILKK